MFQLILFVSIYAFIGYLTYLIIAYRFGFKDDIYSSGIDVAGAMAWPFAIVFMLVYMACISIAYIFTRKPFRRIHSFFVQHIGGRKIDV